MAIGQNFYPDQDLTDLQNLSNMQSGQALGYGDQAAKYADPFMDQRGQYQDQLSALMKNPGSFKSSPFYKFAYDQGMNALQRKGSVRSGNKLAALMKYGQGMASQHFMPYANMLGNFAMSGSSPAAAGLAYARGTERSQDYRQMGAAARAAGNQQQQGAAMQTPFWMQQGEQMGKGMDASSAAMEQSWWDRYNAGGGNNAYINSGAGSNIYNPNTDPYIQNVMNTYYPGGGAGAQFSGGSDGGYQNYWGASDTGAMAEQDYYGYT